MIKYMGIVSHVKILRYMLSAIRDNADKWSWVMLEYLFKNRKNVPLAITKIKMVPVLRLANSAWDIVSSQEHALLVKILVFTLYFMVNVYRKQLFVQQNQDIIFQIIIVSKLVIFARLLILPMVNVWPVVTIQFLRKVQADVYTTKFAKKDTENIKKMMDHVVESIVYAQHGSRKEVNA